jgi:hypothetical protein
VSPGSSNPISRPRLQAVLADHQVVDRHHLAADDAGRPVIGERRPVPRRAEVDMGALGVLAEAARAADRRDLRQPDLLDALDRRHRLGADLFVGFGGH